MLKWRLNDKLNIILNWRLNDKLNIMLNWRLAQRQAEQHAHEQALRNKWPNRVINKRLVQDDPQTFLVQLFYNEHGEDEGGPPIGLKIRSPGIRAYLHNAADTLGLFHATSLSGIMVIGSYRNNLATRKLSLLDRSIRRRLTLACLQQTRENEVRCVRSMAAYLEGGGEEDEVEEVENNEDEDGDGDDNEAYPSPWDICIKLVNLMPLSST